MAAEHPYKLLLAETKKANQKKKPAEDPDPAAPAEVADTVAPAVPPPKKQRTRAKAKAAA